MLEKEEFIEQYNNISPCVYRHIDTNVFKAFCEKYKFINQYKNHNINLYHVVFWLYNQFTPGKVFFEDFQKCNGFEIFEKCKRNYSPNCACYAIMLNDILLAMGLRSKAIWCLSSDSSDTECHALNHVYDEVSKCWIVVDPSCNSIICNELGNPVDLLTLRKTIRNNKYIYPHRNKHIRRSENYIKEYNQYLRKNSFQFLTHNEQGLSYPLEETAILIHPIEYVAKFKKSWKVTNNIAYLYN